jgi:glucuronate isomerase
MGGRLSDNSMESYHFAPATDAEVDAIIAKAIAKESLTQLEVDQYFTKLMEALMKLNNEFDWTMQFHVNSTRNVNTTMFAKIGADTGYDMMGVQPDIVANLQKLFTKMSESDDIPRTIFYSLNPNDWMQLATLMGCFQGRGKQRLQLGAGWWFNDTVGGALTQLEVEANESLLPNFVGMVTDSRSFLSYPRHEYFRRILCTFFGKLVDQGRAPKDEEYLGKIVQDISYNNAYDYFGFFK